MKMSSASSSFKLNPPVNRLIGDMPKIGIRPTIDGRLQGVRESLEKTTMDTCGHIGVDLITLAAMLRISFYMHSVGEEKPFARAHGRLLARTHWKAQNFALVRIMDRFMAKLPAGSYVKKYRFMYQS